MPSDLMVLGSIANPTSNQAIGFSWPCKRLSEWAAKAIANGRLVERIWPLEKHPSLP